VKNGEIWKAKWSYSTAFPRFSIKELKGMLQDQDGHDAKILPIKSIILPVCLSGGVFLLVDSESDLPATVTQTRNRVEVA